MNNDLKRKMAQLVGAVGSLEGWSVDDARSHYFVKPPKPYNLITIGKTPSDVRAFKNSLADVNRVLRQMGRPEVLK